MTAAQWLALALAGGGDGFSTRDCWIALAYSLAGGNTAKTQINAAVVAGWDALDTRDLLMVLAKTL